MEDGSIEVAGVAGMAIYNHAQDVYLQNVYVKAATIIESGVAAPPSDALPGDAGSWKLLRRYVFRVGADQGHFLVNGSTQGTADSDSKIYTMASDVSVPPDLVSRHFWPASFPSWDDAQRISITDFGATRDDATNDDALAIQAALNAVAQVGGPDQGKTVFIPRGHFHVRSAVQVPAGAKLIGAGETISILEVDRSWAPGVATSVLSTVDDLSAEVAFAHFGIVGNEPTSAGGGLPNMTAQRHLRYVTVQSGRMMWRNLQLDQRGGSGTDKQGTEPLVLFTNSAGGKIFNLCLDNNGSSFAANHPQPSHHLLSVAGTSRPLSFYDPSIEHLDEGGGMISLSNVQDARFYALKMEGSGRFLDGSDVAHLQILGGSGNYGQHATAIIRLQGQCPDVRIANVGRQRSGGESPGVWLSDGAVSLADDKPIALFVKDASQLRLLVGASNFGVESHDGGLHSFGGSYLGNSAAQTFTIVNDGFATLSGLELTKTGLDPGDFLESALPVTELAPGASTSFTITFNPSALGIRSAAFHLASNESGTASSYDILVTGHGDVLPTLQSWRQFYFGTTGNSGNAADSFDFDKDGLVNLMEWACDLNPTTAGPLSVTLVRNGGNLEFTYTRSVAALNDGAMFEVEWSDTMPGPSPWSTASVTSNILSDNGTMQQVRATLPVGSSGRRFVRLKVTRPP